MKRISFLAFTCFFACTGVLAFTVDALSQGMNVPHALTVGDDGIIYVLANSLRSDGTAEIHVLALDSAGNPQGSALHGGTRILAADIATLDEWILVAATEVRETQIHDMLLIGYARARLVHIAALPVADECTMSAIWPNPVLDGNEASIDISIPADCRVRIDIHSATGNVVARILDTQLTPGIYTIRFDAPVLPQGLYYCLLDSGTVRHLRKFVVLH
ncbi:MAG: T9SS type A sorting domain-containing protein [Bacteroidetes bacterium]|nr:T9SS type A sorting domain-containing protein [Bacteroidota bacterium]